MRYDNCSLQLSDFIGCICVAQGGVLEPDRVSAHHAFPLDSDVIASMNTSGTASREGGQTGGSRGRVYDCGFLSSSSSLFEYLKSLSTSSFFLSTSSFF